MAKFKVPHIFTDDTTVEAQELNTNFEAISSRFSNLSFRDLSANAQIRNTQLQNSRFETVISGQPIAVENNEWVIGSLPFEQADSYEVVGLSIVLNDGDGAAGQYRFSVRDSSTDSETVLGDPIVSGPTNQWTTIDLSATTTGNIITRGINGGTTFILKAGPSLPFPQADGGGDLIPTNVTIKLLRVDGLR